MTLPETRVRSSWLTWVRFIDRAMGPGWWHLSRGTEGTTLCGVDVLRPGVSTVLTSDDPPEDDPACTECARQRTHLELDT